MTLFAYPTETCKEAAAKHGLQHDLARIAEKIERDQRAVGFDPLGPHIFRKEMGKDFRLISYKVLIDDDQVEVLAAVFRQEGKDRGVYGGDLLDAKHDRPRLMKLLGGEVGAAVLRPWLTQRRAADPPTPLPPPSPPEQEFLYSAFAPNTDDGCLTVFETERWVEAVNSEAWTRWMSSLWKVVGRGPEVPPTEAPDRPLVYWSEEDRVGFVYATDAAHNALLLIEPLLAEGDAADAAARFADLLGAAGGGHSFARLADRAYPAYYLLDFDIWTKIQEDPTANFALSAEEMQLLDGLRTPAAAGTGRREIEMPLFINGRAGSGKSLMLQYAASDLLSWCLARPAANLRVFYTSCSRELVRKAKDMVRRQLRHGHRHALESVAEDRIDALIDDSFVVFHDFARSLLPAAARARFDPDRRIEFPTFKALYATEYAKQNKPRPRVELVWHVIRLLVKGRTTEPHPLPERYDDLPRWCRDTVSRADYDQICTDVYAQWYLPLCRDKGRWDEQDLIAHLLADDAHAAAGRYAAVLCDESQDLTPIEFEFLIGLSLYSRRTVRPEDYPYVPFLFAGDPTQTLNPTGFRWSVVRTVFYEQYVRALVWGASRPPLPTIRELSYNYRSNEGIAKFCNTIQLLRVARLDASDLAPQLTWSLDPATAVCWLDADKSDTKQRLQEMAEAVKLVDCYDGEEQAFASDDTWLHELTLDHESKLHRNVFSPARAKGLEYDTVILYRFGDRAPARASALQGSEGPEDSGDRLQVEYFLNRLYVAASRAERQLIVVDSKAAFEQFWRFAWDNEGTDQLLRRCPEAGRARWRESLGHLLKAPADWDGRTIGPEEQGNGFRTKALADRDSFVMRQAAMAYKTAGRTELATECFALAEEYDKQYAKAAEYYEQLNRAADALRCWWVAQRFPEIVRLAATHDGLAGDLRTRAADAMTRLIPPEAFLDRLEEQTKNEAWCADAQTNPTWPHVLQHLFARLAATKAAPERTTAARHDALAGRVHERIVSLPDPELGLFAHRRGDHKRAVAHWDRAHATKSEPYYESRAAVDPFPHKLVWLHRLGRHADVLKLWTADKPATLDAVPADVLKAVFDSALVARDARAACAVAVATGTADRLKAVFALGLELKDRAAVAQVSEEVVSAHVRAGEWDEALRAAQTGVALPVPPAVQGAFNELTAGGAVRDAVVAALVRELAVSEKLSAAPASQQFQVSDYLDARVQQVPAGVPWQALGAAIERAGKHVSAVIYYEKLVTGSALQGPQRRYAAERWVKCLERMAKYRDDTGEKRDADTRRAQAQRLRNEFKITERLDDYPPATAWAAEPKGFETVFKVELAKRARRLTLTHTETELRVNVSGATLNCTSDDVEVTEGPAENGARCYAVAAWGLTVRVATETPELTLVRVTHSSGDHEARV